MLVPGRSEHFEIVRDFSRKAGVRLRKIRRNREIFTSPTASLRQKISKNLKILGSTWDQHIWNPRINLGHRSQNTHAEPKPKPRPVKK